MKKKVLIILFIVLLIIFVFMSYNEVSNVTNFTKHKEYLKKPVSQQQIEDWMTLNYIKRHFNIDLQEKLGDKYSLGNMKITLKTYCKKKKINCDEFIISLEKKKNGN